MLVLLEARHRVAEPHQVVGGGQPAWTATYYGNRLLTRDRQLLEAILSDIRVALVRDTMQRSNRNRFVIVGALARGLTRVVTDAPEHTRHGVAVPHQLVRLAHAVLCEVICLSTCIDVGGAVAHAWGKLLNLVESLNQIVVFGL